LSQSEFERETGKTLKKRRVIFPEKKRRRNFLGPRSKRILRRLGDGETHATWEGGNKNTGRGYKGKEGETLYTRVIYPQQKPPKITGGKVCDYSG